MARTYSLENPMQIVPEHAGSSMKNLSSSVAHACNRFFREHGMATPGLREVIHKGATEGEARKKRRKRARG